MQNIFEQFWTFKCHDEHAAVQRAASQEGLGFAGCSLDGFSPISLIHSHTGNCHVCPRCEEQLHSDLAPLSEPTHRGCTVCQDWLSSQKPRTYSVPSISDGDRQSPAGTRYSISGCSCSCSPGTGPWETKQGGRQNLYVDKVSFAAGIHVVPVLAGARIYV